MDDFDSLVEDPKPSTQQEPAQQISPERDSHELDAGAQPQAAQDSGSFDDLVDDRDVYGTPMQTAGAGAESVSRGFLGKTPTAAIETHLLGITPESIQRREEVHPTLSTAGEMIGLGAGFATGLGPEAIVLNKLGKAMEAVPLVAKGLTKGASYLSKVGSAAAKGAADMAIMQGDDEVAKQVLHDPNATAESAMMHIGIATALGGAGGALASGVISPLWSATKGSALAKSLGNLRSHIDGNAAIAPEQVQNAIDLLGPKGKAYTHNEVSPQDFYNKIQEVVQDKNPMYKANITPYSAEDYANFKTYMSADGKSGYAIKPDGELISVFSKAKGRGESIVDDAVLNKGAQKLDAFDINGKLPELYGKYMDETSRLKFADEYAPKDWDYNKLGRPDVVMMGLNPAKVSANLSEGALDIDPIIRAAISGNPAAIEKFNVLREVQKPEVLEAMKKYHSDLSDSVMKRMGVAPEDIAVHSDNEAGHSLLETFGKEYKEKYQPIAEALTKRNTEAAGISISDDARMHTYGSLLEDGMAKVGTDSPAYKLYNEYGNRILAKDTVGGMDMLKTEIGNNIKQAVRAGDFNTSNALQDIKSAISDLQEREIEKTAASSEKLGMKGAVKSGEELLAERAAANKGYAEFAKMSDTLTNHLGVGDFRGAGSLSKKLADKISPEEVLRKFSIRGNADFIPFLAEHFPETLKEVQASELKKFLKPAVLGAKDEMPINIKKLSDIIDKGMAGQKEYVESILPKGAIEAVNAAKSLQDALPNYKSSGTAGWMSKVYSKLPQSAVAAISLLTGHNPIFGYVLGEGAHALGRKVPDAMNLAYLRFIGSNQPVKAEGFKAMVDLLDATYKGNNTISKAVTSVFESGSKVIPQHLVPDSAALMKLDKVVNTMQEHPYKMIAHQDDHTGHYLPEHKTAMVETTGRIVQYLSTLKPHAQPSGALGTPIQVSKQDAARYNRALEIAQQPAILLQRVKSGTLSKNDVVDLNNMYPSLYKTMSTKLHDQMVIAKSQGTPVPYKTRMGLSLFLAAPVDNSMHPANIQAAQSAFAPKTPPQQPQMGQGSKPTQKAMSDMGKGAKSYQTPLQSSEAHKAEHK